MSFGDRVVRTGPGRFELRMEAGERKALGALVGELRDVVAAGPADRGVERLFPTAYTDDEEREAEYQRLMRDELLQTRLAAIDTVLTTLEERELDEGQLTAWMRSLNDLRLVIGTRLDIQEDDPLEIEPDDPDAGAHHLYLALGYLLEEVVAALAD